MQPTEFHALPGHLYVVATPIGNLRDITLRALDILKSVDVVAAEDTRTSSGLLAAYGIRAQLVACHEHNEKAAAAVLVGRLQAGESVAFISDAGTPGISDPGAWLVRQARAAGLPVLPLPGPSAAAAALSVAGLETGHWLFYGFLPAKAGPRRKALETLKALPYPLVFYEAPHRLAETLADLTAVLGPERQLFLARELTKRFESCHACRLAEVAAWLGEDANRLRGEFVLIVEGAREDAEAAWQAAVAVLTVLREELPASQAARLAARLTGARKNALYDVALKGSDKVTSDEVTSNE
jgi:16S rRNA (cytidine1402-2'-O)-methyltransferase